MGLTTLLNILEELCAEANSIEDEGIGWPDPKENITCIHPILYEQVHNRN